MTEERVSKQHTLNSFYKKEKGSDLSEYMQIGDNVTLITKAGYILDGRVKPGGKELNLIKLGKGTQISRHKLSFTSDRFMFFADDSISILF